MIFYISDGRLGNQLFQYAFLKSFANKNENIFVFNMHQFCQSVGFGNINFKVITLGKYGLFFLRSLIKPLILKIFVRSKLVGYVKQDRSKISALPSYQVSKGLLPITLVESDFFQSEIFFKPDSLDLTIKKEYIIKARDFISSIPEEFIKIFVHVRRGDYLFETYLDQRGINLPKTYFESAMSEIKKEVKNPYFIFLSDDPEYVECCFKDIENKLVSNNEMATDLAIMSLCEYGITSNSSFSWWGAYLMSNRKKVIYPKYWYGWKSRVESHIGIQPSWGTVIEVDKVRDLNTGS
jgi:hypothetical protein